MQVFRVSMCCDDEVSKLFSSTDSLDFMFFIVSASDASSFLCRSLKVD